MDKTKNQVCVQDAGMEKRRNDIINLVNGITDIWILRQVYNFIINMTKEGD